MLIAKLLFAVATFVCTVHTEVPFVTKCLSSDKACLRKSAQDAIPIFANGIPEFKIQPLDPLRIAEVDASTNSLKFISTNAVVTGLKNCLVLGLERNIAASTQIFEVECNVEYRSKYDLHGNVLIVPFEGSGDMTVKLRQIYLKVETIMANKVDKAGRNHWHIKSYKYSYDLKGKSDIELTNLFQGNELLGRAARELLASSGNEIIVEVGTPILKAIVEKIIKSVQLFFRSTAPDDLAFD